MKPRLLQVSRVTRSAIYQPLAAVLAVLLLPTFAWMESTAGIPPGATARSFESSAQIVVQGCGTSRGNLIIQNVCVNGTSYDVNGDLTQFESDSVNAYLTEHNLPASDASLIYSEGRTDLRNDVRGYMLAALLGIITESPSSRTAHETVLYNWLQALVQQNEIAEYTAALAEYQKWQNDPCTYQLDPNIAAQYGLSYNGALLCEPTNVLLSGAPYVPAASYFMAVGLENSYGKSSQTYSNFASLVASTGLNVGEAVGISAAIGTAVGAAVGGAIAAVFQLTDVLLNGYVADEPLYGLTAYTYDWGTSGAVESIADSEEVLGAAGEFAGPAAIILIAVLVGVEAGMVVSNNQQNLNQLNNLPNLLAQAQNTPPDLNALLKDTTGLGQYKLDAAFVSQTVPDIPSSAALPPHNAGDAVLVITPSGGTGTVQSSFSYDDWNGIAWQATTSGGWFDLTCQGNSSGQGCGQANSFNGSIQYVDWSGKHRIAARLGNNFTIADLSPSSTEQPCPADPNTGLSTSGNFNNCSSYVSTQIQYMYQGDQYTLTLTNQPGFSSATTIYFSLNGGSQTAAVTAVGTPTPAISLVSGSMLPPGVGFSGSSSQGIGSAQFTFSGSSTLTPGNYSVTLQAASVQGATTQTFTIVLASQLQIFLSGLGTGIFGPTISVPYGQPVSFAVNTTGVSPINLSITPGFLPAGLNFHDNGNGTGTISGTTTAAGFYPYPGCIAGVTAPTCTPAGSITATGPQGTVTLPFTVEVNSPPSPTLATSTAIFIAGLSNSFRLTTADTLGPVVTPVVIGFSNVQYEPVPSWLSLQDNGDGTATLSGTPPPGTSNRFFVAICPEAKLPGWAGSFVCTPNFTLNVNDQPVFVNPNTATFTVGDPGSFTIATNQSTGPITESGALPNGLEFTDNGDGTATVSGTPAAGSGGVTTLQLSITSDTGTGTQALNLQVNQPLAFVSANWVNFAAGQENSFQVQLSGYPLLSSAPAAQSQTAANYVSGAVFTVSGLPGDLSYSNSNPEGYNTGTLTLSGNPSSSDYGFHTVTISADNGVGSAATQALTLNIEPIPGDVNDDGAVNCTDFDLVKASFGAYRGQPGYNPMADLNNNGVINIQDLAIVSRNLPEGTVCH